MVNLNWLGKIRIWCGFNIHVISVPSEIDIVVIIVIGRFEKRFS